MPDLLQRAQARRGGARRERTPDRRDADVGVDRRRARPSSATDERPAALADRRRARRRAAARGAEAPRAGDLGGRRLRGDRAARALAAGRARSSRRAGIRPGEDVLDVACGTGNAAIRAAQAGGRVVGLDLTPELLEHGRRLAAERGRRDRVGRGRRRGAAVRRRELRRRPLDARRDVRAAPPGRGRRARARAAPRRPARPVQLGRGQRRRARDPRRSAATCRPRPRSRRRPGSGARRSTSARSSRAPASSSSSSAGWWSSRPSTPPSEDVDYHATRFGPLLAARALTEADGRWPALRAELEPLHEGLVSAEYLLVLGRRGRRVRP